jgi:putative oxygen-independent coproporphyrinogen III oxidase
MTTSLYIHWPFCKSKCPYCDFNSHVNEKIEFDRWQAAYLRQIEYYSNRHCERPAGAWQSRKNWIASSAMPPRNDGNEKLKIDTIFFGGGTPSLMKPEMVKAILEKVKKEFEVEKDIEVTLEANPSSSETEKFRDFKSAGINRVSIGVQSFDEDNLKFLGRRHDRKQAIHAIESAGNIFGNFSFDLIYALPAQNTDNWGKELDFALSFGSPHISLYQLTIEKGTPFYADHNKGKFKLPEEELQTELYLLTLEKCKKAGLERYEISNFAKRGFESRHNLNYWLQNDYIGIGPGAHGRIEEGDKGSGTRVATMDIHHPGNWLEAVEAKGHGTQTTEILSRKEILEELIFMGLRIREGIKLNKFEELGFIKNPIKNSTSSRRRPGSIDPQTPISDLKSENDISSKLDSGVRRNDDMGVGELFDQKLIQKLCDEGLMEINEERIRLTEKGLLLHTNIVRKLTGN